VHIICCHIILVLQHPQRHESGRKCSSSTAVTDTGLLCREANHILASKTYHSRMCKPQPGNSLLGCGLRVLTLRA
jgi:hypothetical protein